MENKCCDKDFSDEDKKLLRDTLDKITKAHKKYILDKISAKLEEIEKDNVGADCRPEYLYAIQKMQELINELRQENDL